jgi:malonate-semialdehyde dehydrogenase (acetylating)/methylmalonate-semialdehyde dehydrogenase
MNAAVTTELKTIGHWIAGEATRGESGRSGSVFNPATGEQTGEVAFASVEEIDRAVAAAKNASATWRQWSLSKRAELFFRIYQLLDEHRDDLARLLTAEHGKVLSDAHGEVQRGIEVIEYVCGIPELLKGGYSEQVSTGSTSTRSGSHSASSRGSRPSTSRPMVPMWMWAPAIACGNTFI